MAIQGGLKRKSKVTSEIPDSSLADIAFLLLIFFMVSTKFRKETPREVQEPSAEATQQIDEKRDNILHLWVEEGGSVYINDVQVAMQDVSAVVEPLYEESNEELIVSIRADREVPYNTINQVTEELREGGALRVNFATHVDEAAAAAPRR